jgi:hypothetical protein
MEALGAERKHSSYSFMTSALDMVSDQPHAPAALYPLGKDPRYPLGRGLRAGLDTEARRKMFCLCWGSNLGRPVCGHTLY